MVPSGWQKDWHEGKKEMSYFDGIRIDDEVFIVGLGRCIVHRITSGVGHPLSIGPHNCPSYNYRQYNYDGVRFNEELQSAFWSDPQIVAPPRPKRMKKVKVEVRPYQLCEGSNYLLAPSSGNWFFCGPTQTVTIEVEDD